jgi:hypothetical protein
MSEYEVFLEEPYWLEEGNHIKQGFKKQTDYGKICDSLRKNSLTSNTTQLVLTLCSILAAAWGMFAVDNISGVNFSLERKYTFKTVLWHNVIFRLW